MLDFISSAEKAKSIANKYGLKLQGNFELKKVCFTDKAFKDGLFWTYNANQDSALISVYGFMKIIDNKKIIKIENLSSEQNYPMCGNYFKLIKTDKGQTLQMAYANF